jgi:hypothetical protein
MRIVYKIMLSGQGDWLVWVNEGNEDYWFAEQKIDTATSFSTHSDALSFIKKYNIKYFWPQANIQSVGVADTASVA